MDANTQVRPVTEHGFSLHSRRPFTCRICKQGAEVHTFASPESQATWLDANTADVTPRMAKYSERTLAVVRMAAAQGGDLSEHNLTSCGLHATAVKIVKADGILVNTTPGLGGIWSLSPVGRQLCLHFGIEIVTPEAEISAPTGQAAECICGDIMDAGAASLPVGGKVCPGCGSVFTVEGTEASPEVLAESGRVVAGKATLLDFSVDDISIPTNTPVIDGFEWKRHTNPGESVWAGSTYQLIVAGTHCQVAATVKHRGNGLWTAQTCYWGNAGLTKDFWGGEPLADAFANVVAHQDFLSRAQAAGLSGLGIARIMDWRTWQAPECTLCGRTDTLGRDDQVTPFPHECVTAAQAEAGRFVPRVVIPNDAEVSAMMAEHDAAMGEWVKPLLPALGFADRLHDELDGPSPFALPVRTPGETLSAWDMAESEIWAGTDQVARMRFPRKMKKARRKFDITQMGMAMPRRIDVKRARIAKGW